MRLPWLLMLSAALVLLGGTGSGPRGLYAGPKPPAPELPAFTPERETAALQFVAQHHAELGEVLARLKKLNRDQYEQAIRQLFQESEKLALIKANDDKLYDLMLEAWKANSQIEVVAARLACSKDRDAALEAELKKLLYRQVDLHRQTIEHNRQRGLESLKVMEANIKLLGEKRDEMVERRFRNLTGGKKAAPPTVPAPPK